MLIPTLDAELRYPHYRNAAIGNYAGVVDTIMDVISSTKKQVTDATTKAAEAETKRTLWQIAGTGLLLAAGMLVVYDVGFRRQKR